MSKLVFAAFLVAAGLGARWALGKLLEAYGRGPRPSTPPPAVLLLRRVVPWGIWGLAFLVVFFSIFVVVGPGRVGVVQVFGRVEPAPLYSGLHAIAPWKDVTEMSVQVLKHEAKYDAASIDIQAVHTIMVINFAIVPEKAPEIFQRVGLAYEAVIIDPAANETLKANTALHAANDILQQRPKIKADVEQGLIAWLAKYSILVKEVSIKDIHFDKDFETAVEQKQIAQQIAQKKKYEVEQATQDALSNVARAKGVGDAARAEAAGNADALRIKGSAESEYNIKVSASLTAALIQKVYLDKWDGKVSQYQLGGAAALFQIPNPQAQKSVVER